MRTGARRHGYVFTWADGSRIRDIGASFKSAVEKAKLVGITPHAFRRTCITRWTNLKIPWHIVMRASGHVDKSQHAKYVIITKEAILEPFREAGLLSAPAERAFLKTA